MKSKIFSLLALGATSSLFSSVNLEDIESWSQEVVQVVDQEDLEWAREEDSRKMDTAEVEHYAKEAKEHFQNYLKENSCKACGPSVDQNTPDDFPLIVAVSFSLPEEAWLGLSKEMEGLPATFVVQGIPKNSFLELSRRLDKLKQRGMNATVQVDPQSFEDFHIERVPCFVLRQEKGFDKMSGNVSLSYALGEFQSSGDTSIAREFWELYQRGSDG